jgi:putative hydrolase of the HAD superfamily
VSRALEEAGVRLDAATFVERFLGDFRASVRRSLAEDHREITLRELIPEVLLGLGQSCEGSLLERLVEAHYAPIVAQVSLYPGTAEILSRLRGAGLKIGLVSNTIWPEPFHVHDLRRFGILGEFDCLVFSSTLGVAKPNQRIFREALDRLGVAPEESFYVGDRPEIDVLGAQSIGMAAVLKRHPLRSLERHEGIVPDAVIDDLRELADLVGV